jgi:hypothetical protein
VAADRCHQSCYFLRWGTASKRNGTLRAAVACLRPRLDVLNGTGGSPTCWNAKDADFVCAAHSPLGIAHAGERPPTHSVLHSVCYRGHGPMR